MSEKKVYVEYARPFESEDDEPPVVECWIDGQKPPKKRNKSGLIYVYSDSGDTGVCGNERLWDGVE